MSGQDLHIAADVPTRGRLSELVRRQFGSDLLAGISIVAAVLLGEYLAGAFVVLVLSGGEALEAFAARMREYTCRVLPITRAVR